MHSTYISFFFVSSIEDLQDIVNSSHVHLHVV